MEQNYDIGNRELLAIKLALEEWQHWLEGANHPFTVITDHKNLQYLRQAKRLNPRQARWALFFTRFDFTITYRPGNRNCKADALSRVHSPDSPTEPEPILPPALIVNPIIWNINRDIRGSEDQSHSYGACSAGRSRRENFRSNFHTAIPSGLSTQSTGLWTSRQPTDPLAPPSSVLVARYVP